MSEEINNEAQTPLEAAIDNATGYKPGDETKPAGDETKPAEAKESAEPAKEKRDWVKEAYECFVKNAVDADPTDPVKAVAAYFEKNATDELKEKVKAEGKTAEGCWKFVEAVARKALGGRSGHVDPVAVYAIAMHYFQDVPADWNEPKKKPQRPAAGAKAAGPDKETSETPSVPVAVSEAPAESPAGKPAKKHAGKPKKKSHRKTQGFFFDMMETETVGPDQEGEKNEVR